MFWRPYDSLQTGPRIRLPIINTGDRLSVSLWHSLWEPVTKTVYPLPLSNIQGVFHGLVWRNRYILQFPRQMILPSSGGGGHDYQSVRVYWTEGEVRVRAVYFLKRRGGYLLTLFL